MRTACASSSAICTRASAASTWRRTRPHRSSSQLRPMPAWNRPKSSRPALPEGSLRPTSLLRARTPLALAATEGSRSAALMPRAERLCCTRLAASCRSRLDCSTCPASWPSSGSWKPAHQAASSSRGVVVTASPCHCAGSPACGRTKSGPIVQAATARHRAALASVFISQRLLMRPPRPAGPRALPPTCRRAVGPAAAGPVPARSSPECAAPPW